MMDVLKLGPRMGRQNSYGAVQALWKDVRFLFKTALEQPGNSLYGARPCDVTGALDLLFITVEVVSCFPGSLQYFIDVKSARLAIGCDSEGKLLIIQVDGHTGERG